MPETHGLVGPHPFRGPETFSSPTPRCCTRSSNKWSGAAMTYFANAHLGRVKLITTDKVLPLDTAKADGDRFVLEAHQVNLSAYGISFSEAAAIAAKFLASTVR